MRSEWTVHKPVNKLDLPYYERVIGAYRCFVHFNFLGWCWSVWTDDNYPDECVGKGGPLNKGRAKEAAYRCAFRLIDKDVTKHF